MNDEFFDEQGKRLFREAREEAPPEGAARRALERARSERLRDASGSARRTRAASGLVLLGAGFAAAAGLALLLRPATPEPAISAERVEPSPRREVSPDPQPPAESATAAVSASPSARVVAPSPSSSPPARSAPATLAEELELLTTAERSLAASDPQAALKTLDRYERAMGNRMRAEATLLRIEALSRAGDARAASDLARRFVDQHPTSPLVDRARSFIPSEESQ